MIQKFKVPFTTSKIRQFSSSFAVVANLVDLEIRVNAIGNLVNSMAPCISKVGHYLTS